MAEMDFEPRRIVIHSPVCLFLSSSISRMGNETRSELETLGDEALMAEVDLASSSSPKYASRMRHLLRPMDL